MPESTGRLIDLGARKTAPKQITITLDELVVRLRNEAGKISRHHSAKLVLLNAAEALMALGRQLEAKTEEVERLRLRETLRG